MEYDLMRLPLEAVMTHFVGCTLTLHQVKIDDKIVYHGGVKVHRHPVLHDLSAQLHDDSLIQLIRRLAESADSFRKVND